MKTLFDKIQGQDRPLKILKRAIESNRVPTAYLFTGPPGCGRKMAAIAMAASLNCETGGLACGVCSSCKQHTAGTHLDLHITEPAPGKTGILLDQIKRVIGKAILMPMQGKFSVFIVNGAHTMNMEATNTFLKTLEEPPATSRFILIAPDRDSVLPTISSRCQTLSFSPLGRHVVRKLLEKEGIGGERAELLSSMARGSMERALTYQSEEVPEKLADEFEPLASLHKSGHKELLDLAERWGRNREEALGILDFMVQWYRDMMILSLDGPEDQVIHISHLRELQEGATALKAGSLSTILEAIEDARDDLNKNTNVELTLDRLLLTIRSYAPVQTI